MIGVITNLCHSQFNFSLYEKLGNHIYRVFHNVLRDYKHL